MILDKILNYPSLPDVVDDKAMSGGRGGPVESIQNSRVGMC